MMKMDRHGLSLEQNLRLDEVISRFKPLREAEAERLRNDGQFLLDCLYGDDPSIRRLALQRLREIVDKPIDLDLALPEAARIEAINAVRERLYPQIDLTGKGVRGQ